MESRAHMWATYSTIRASKIGFKTLLSHLPLLISLLFIRKSCPTSSISPSAQITLRPCQIYAISWPMLNPCLCMAQFCPFLVNSNSVTMPRRYEPSSYVDLFTIPDFAQCREVFLHDRWGPFLSSL
jgi:hypothetical protein